MAIRRCEERGAGQGCVSMGDDRLQPLCDLRAYLRWLERTGMVPSRAAAPVAAPPRNATPPLSQARAAVERQAARSAPAPPPTPDNSEALMTTTPVPFSPDDPKGRALLDMAAEVAACRACPLGAERTNPVFGVGSPDADLVFIGEAPRSEERRGGEECR